MSQIVEMTYEERVAMYSKLSKKELIAMLIEVNTQLSIRIPIVTTSRAIDKGYTIIPLHSNTCSIFTLNPGSTTGNCIYCGKPKSSHSIMKIT